MTAAALRLRESPFAPRTPAVALRAVAAAICVCELSGGRPGELERFLDVAPDRRAAGGALQFSERFLAGETSLGEDVEQLLVVAAEGHDVARCAAFVNRSWQLRHREATGFIGFVAGRPDQQPAIAMLLTRAEEWLAGRGATRVVAPFNGIETLGAGVRTLASDESADSPRIPMERHWINCLLSAGYSSLYPWWSYRTEARLGGRQRAVRGVFYSKALETGVR
jgi:hypothetical protein